MGWFIRKPPEGHAESGAPAPKPHRAPSVRVSDLLTENTVMLVLPGTDKAQMLEGLVRAACGAHALGDPVPFLARVREREEGISTTLDTGLSLPHARMDGINGIIAALAVAADGVNDPKQPGLKIRAMFLFFSPNKQEAFTQHLQLLRSVSTTFQPALIDELTRAATPRAVIELLRAKSA